MLNITFLAGCSRKIATSPFFGLGERSQIKSSLLAKFRVRGRMELVREASRQTAGAVPVPMPVATREARNARSWRATSEPAPLLSGERAE